MLTRIISALIGIPLLLFIVVQGGIFIYLGVLIISLIGLKEFYIALEKKQIQPIKWIGYISSFLLLTDFYLSSNGSFFLPIIVLSILTLSVIGVLNIKYNFIDSIITLYGMIYVVGFLGHIILTHNQENNVIIWLIFLTAWGTDTFAYFSGYLFGKTKLCPLISPKKTIEGAIGGILGSMITSGIFAYFFIPEALIPIIILGFIGSIFSQIGDLTASKIKRYIGIKDFGNIMPGHGGVLDRFDSIIFTAPVVYYFLILFIN
ncbi:phosphatidate cytidylyltransferase [Alkaliphilus metalliredigens QYMF]|uniref:Phosphatidate cytidylyltransferase n=1 Tax=Alkaliphilus metalliredigens (strain QYMF) TaxID=293826 RepID=A6TRL7_ALKMQ|nr:phosphatidate cytidylyltransferase [Alkaliphilus metalliredigens]ABR48835.1 phosphatidate cytidylyltransferase [Alkaliphilus metalliredigens QYMF]